MPLNQIEIQDIDENILGDLNGLCIPKEKVDDPFFIEGNFLWKKWMLKNMGKFGSIGKVAYLNSEIVGMIQYLPKPEHKIVEIKCTFVKKSKRNKGIRKTLLEETIKEFEEPKPYFDDQKAKALVTLPYPSPRPIENADFYKENEFRQLSEDYEHLLYYPLTEDYVEYEYIIDPTNLPIDELDKNKALILCNTHCPYCVEEMVETFKKLRKLNSDIPVKLVVPFEEPEEFTCLFSMPLCVVINGKSIGFSIIDDNEFLERMRDALDSGSDLINHKIQRSDLQKDIRKS